MTKSIYGQENQRADDTAAAGLSRETKKPTAESPFDHGNALRLLAARIRFLDQMLQDWQGPKISTALDVGTGVGNFAGHLARYYGMHVTGVDIRSSNVQEAQQRHPDVRFLVNDLEEPEIQSLGKFDLVNAFGILYHLENPARAVRHLAHMTAHLLVIESMIAPGKLPQAQMLDEQHGDDQGIRYFALHPTEAGLVKLLYRAGMPYVYKPVLTVQDPEFQAGIFKRRLRTVLIASRTAVSIPWLRAMAEPSYVADRSYGFYFPFRVLLRKILEYRQNLRR